MKNYLTLRYACYSANVTMSVVANLSPVLFLTFRELYGISYSLLGLLVFINFATQLLLISFSVLRAKKKSRTRCGFSFWNEAHLAVHET